MRVHERYVCDLDVSRPTARVGRAKPAGKEMSRFILVHMSLPGEPDRFGIGTGNGTTVGIGQKQADGRWVIHDWRPEDARGPAVTLVTVFKRGVILVSIGKGRANHNTYEGRCVKA